jgi:methyltransferase (TIGR00027 family)
MRHAFGVNVEGDQSVPAGVGLTALAVAAARAIESSRSDRLFDDPFAQDFFLFFAVRAQSRPESSNQASIDLWTSMGDYVALRTRFLDDFLFDSCQAGCRQVVLLGAGLDARAYRLSWPEGVRLFELDTDDVLSFKERVISGRQASPRCQRVAIASDLRDDWPAILRRAGFDPQQPTAWLAEGLLRYLGAAETVRLLERVTSLSAAASRLAVEYSGADALRDPEMIASLAELDVAAAEDQSRLWGPGELDDDPEPWLASHGWQTSVHRIDELAREHGRPVPPAFAAVRANQGGIVVAEISSADGAIVA